MLRFILVRRRKDAHTGCESAAHFTLDADVEELENVLRRGGFGPNEYDMTELIGVEVLPKEPTDG